jgi:hypothetical protein
MTRYAVDEARQALVGLWSTGSGDVAITVADLPSTVRSGQALLVAEAASGLSEALWRCYTHPASVTGSLEPDTEGWRRQRSRDGFALVADAVRQPNLPHNGLLIRAYDPVTEYAHQLGRALHAIGDPGLTGRVVADVQAELDGVERAERGDVSGRAQQAVILSRQDASPVQIAAADRLLQEDPLDGSGLFTGFDPAAAAVAAAHWLWAAAMVATDRSGLAIAEVMRTADDIEALPWETPAVVLGQLADGEPPRSVVLGLISDAMLVAEGKIPDLITLLELAAQAEARAGSDLELCEALIAAIRPTPLDPARPALDLLEDLLSGIRGCWLVFTEYAHNPGASGEDDDFSGGGSGGDDDDIDGTDAITGEFISLVRVAAAEEHDQLL